MTAREIRAQLSEAIRSDRRAAAILKKIAAGRANFSDTMDYSLICGRLTGSQLAEAVLELSEDREELTEALLHDRYEDINARCAEVQTALDDKQGLHLAPQKADFPAERAAKFAHSLLDPTVTDETIKRRARSVSENITVTFHDDFIRENAAFRDRAGLKCYVTRSTSGGCCDWCSNVAGRYLMQEQPEGLFRRHDNCDCTIVYDGQVLRGQSGVSGRRGRRWVEDKPKVEYTPPKRFSHDEAEKLQAGKMPKRLTNGADSGIIGENSKKPITLITEKSIESVPLVSIDGYSEEQCLFIQNQHKELLKKSLDDNNSCEVAFVFNNLFGNRRHFYGSDDIIDFKNTLFDKDSFVMHNHPRNSSYSVTDLIFFIRNQNVKTFTIVKNNGNIEFITKGTDYNEENFKLEYDRLYRKIVKSGTDSEKDKFVRTLLSKTKSGVTWSGRE